jgi:hypothetical protein
MTTFWKIDLEAIRRFGEDAVEPTALVGAVVTAAEPWEKEIGMLQLSLLDGSEATVKTYDGEMYAFPVRED